MKTAIFVITICCVLFTVYSCASAASVDADSASWAGTYAGVIPAASSLGIDAIIVLNADKTYRISYRYIDRSDEVFMYAGTFAWNPVNALPTNGKTITLDASNLPPYYKVTRGFLIQLDLEGKEIKGKPAGNYRLRKVSIDNV